MFIHGELTDFIDWYDVDGNIINVSDGGIIYVDGTYYWYGLQLRPLPFNGNGLGGQTTKTGVAMYSSKDLENWKYEGIILHCSDDPNSELYGPMRFERPKIIYNDKTKKYVLWCHFVKNPGDHTYEDGAAEAGVAICDTINGTYEWLGHTRPIDESGVVRDCTLYKDKDGSAYFIYDRDMKGFDGKNRCLYLVKLSDDYLSTTDDYKRLDEAFWREGTGIVYYKDYYYMITSDLTGWNFNQAKYFRAKSLYGPWEDMGDPCVDDATKTTFHSQTTYIFKVEGREDLYIHMAERHNVNNFERCSYIWLPIEFLPDNKLQLTYKKSWQL